MPQEINRLTERTVAAYAKAVAEKGRQKSLHDGLGLYLGSSTFRTCSWYYRVPTYIRPKGGWMGLGSVRTVSLKKAREKAQQCRDLVDKGIDPIEHRRDARAALQAERAKARTFKECANAFMKSQGETWDNAKHASQWRNTLKAYVYPTFGDLSIAEIDTSLVIEALEPIWATKTETAKRVRGRIERILDWAAIRGYRTGENPARWRGHLEYVLPKPSGVREIVHHAALPYAEMGAFFQNLRVQETVAAAGLEFLILTAARTGEVIAAEWVEFDLENKVWTVPKERMKGQKGERRPHRVPLSEPALSIVGRMKGVKESGYVFPGGKHKRPLSNMAFLKLLKRMKRDNVTAHGFRSTFRDWAAECTAYPNHVVEMALAHKIPNAVEAAYRRGDLFEKRRRLMDDWARFCATVEHQLGTVVPLRL